MNGRIELVELLLETRKVKPSYIFQGQILLTFAALRGYYDIVRVLVTIYGVDPDSKDEDGATSLWLAVKSRYNAVVKLLLEIG